MSRKSFANFQEFLDDFANFLVTRPGWNPKIFHKAHVVQFLNYLLRGGDLEEFSGQYHRTTEQLNSLKKLILSQLEDFLQLHQEHENFAKMLVQKQGFAKRLLSGMREARYRVLEQGKSTDYLGNLEDLVGLLGRVGGDYEVYEGEGRILGSRSLRMLSL